MVVLFVSEFFYPRLAGGELVSWAILNGLARKGHKIYVVTSQMPDTVEHEEINGIEIFRPFSSCNLVEQKGVSSSTAVIKRITFMIKLYFYLGEFLKHHSIDVVYNIGYVTALSAAWSASRNHLPAVSSIRSLAGKTWFQLTNPFLAMFNYLGEILIICLGRYNALHCPSSEVTRKVQGHTSTRVFTIPNPLDLDEIKQVKENTNSELIRKSLGIKQEEQFLLFVGSLIKVKNVDGLIKALSSSEANFKLIVIGEGPERPKIGNLARSLHLEGKIIFVGRKSHKETLSIMKSCDVLVLPSKSEVFPNTVIEALALGNPAIATKVGGIPEMKSRNLYLINSIEEINQLLEKGIKPEKDERVLEEYAVDKIVKEFEGLLENTIRWKGQA